MRRAGLIALAVGAALLIVLGSLAPRAVGSPATRGAEVGARGGVTVAKPPPVVPYHFSPSTKAAEAQKPPQPPDRAPQP